MYNSALKTLALFVAAAAVPTICAAQDATIARPSFWDLESSYPRDTRLNKAQNAAQMDQAKRIVSESVPAGTPLAIAEARLRDGGADCRANRRAIGVVKCLYHQYDLSDGAADDIRWTITLRSAGDAVSDISVDRYVDRKGSS